MPRGRGDCRNVRLESESGGVGRRRWWGGTLGPAAVADMTAPDTRTAHRNGGEGELRRAGGQREFGRPEGEHRTLFDQARVVRPTTPLERLGAVDAIRRQLDVVERECRQDGAQFVDGASELRRAIERDAFLREATAQLPDDSTVTHSITRDRQARLIAVDAVAVEMRK